MSKVISRKKRIGFSKAYKKKEELVEWEAQEIKKALKYVRRLYLRYRKRLPLSSASRSLPIAPGLNSVQFYEALVNLNSLSYGREMSGKSLDTSHLLVNGELIFHGDKPFPHPKPIYQKNGDRSIADLIFNPAPPTGCRRPLQHFKMLKKIINDFGVELDNYILTAKPAESTLSKRNKAFAKRMRKQYPHYYEGKKDDVSITSDGDVRLWKVYSLSQVQAPITYISRTSAVDAITKRGIYSVIGPRDLNTMPKLRVTIKKKNGKLIKTIKQLPDVKLW